MIVLSGEPRSTQNLYRYACRGNYPTMYMTKDGRELKAAYAIQARLQWRRKPTPEPLQISVTLYHGTKRKADWDNFHKIAMDALNGIVWEDDSQIIEANVRKEYDPKRPRIEIEINQLP